MTYTVSYYIWENQKIKHKKGVIKLEEGERVLNHLKQLHGEDYDRDNPIDSRGYTEYMWISFGCSYFLRIL